MHLRGWAHAQIQKPEGHTMTFLFCLGDKERCPTTPAEKVRVCIDIRGGSSRIPLHGAGVGPMLGIPHGYLQSDRKRRLRWGPGQESPTSTNTGGTR